MIFAGLHYAGAHGGMHSLTTSYLHHKVQCIQRVNGWIADENARVTAPCLRLIGTLCISEVRHFESVLDSRVLTFSAFSFTLRRFA